MAHKDFSDWVRGIAVLSVSLMSFVSPKPALAISEKGYETEFRTRILPFYESNGVSGIFSGVAEAGREVPISYRVFEVPNEKAAIVILNGRTESYRKYAEVIYELTQAGFSVYTMDHRGQGYSGRMTSDPQVGYVRHFSDYTKDVDQFMTTVVRAKPHHKVFLLTHSMGGLIGSLYLSTHPDAFNAAVLSAPMLEINTGKYPEPVAYLIGESSSLVGRGKTFSIGQADYNPNSTFESNDVTHSRVRFEMNKALIAETPSLALGGVSNRWVEQSLTASWKIQSKGDTLKMPLLIFQAGNDALVKPKGQDRVCGQAGNCRIVRFPGSFHEILMEQDSIRDRAMSEMLRFFDAQIPLR